MSGIYIKDWDKPEICTDCPCFNEYTQCCQVDIMADIDSCPLIFVPDHGRLVDIQPLMRGLYEEMMTGSESYTTEEVYAMIDKELASMPTIIPADHFGEVTEMEVEEAKE